MIPAEQMRQLFAVHGRPPWELVSFAHAGHMDAYDSAAAQYWPAVRRFVDELFPEDLVAAAAAVAAAADAMQ
jgi:hypothetical protein